MHFANWLKSQLKYKSADIMEYNQMFPKANDKPSDESLYIEIQKAHLPLGKKGTLYPQLHKDREDGKESLYKAICNHI